MELEDLINGGQDEDRQKQEKEVEQVRSEIQQLLKVLESRKVLPDCRIRVTYPDTM